MSIWSKLFGSEKAVDGIYNGIDAAILTSEEKVKYHQDFLRLYEPFKIAQRLLALTFCIPYALAWVTTFAMTLFGADVTNEMEMLGGNLSVIVGVITGFYFGGGAIEGIIKGARRQ